MKTLSLVAAFFLLFAQAALAVEPDYLIAIAVAPDGKTYVADRKLPGVFVYEEGKFTPFFTGMKKFGTPLNAVRCLAVDGDGRLLAGDSATREVYRFDEAGQPVPLTKGGIGIPMSIAVLESGDLLVADLELHRIWKVPGGGGQPEVFAEVPAPRGLFVDGANRVWVLSHGQDQLLRLNAEGKESEVIVKGRPFEFPNALVVDKQGAAYVCDTYGKAIWRIAAGQQPEKCSSPLLKNPVALAIAGEELLIVDPKLREIVRIKLAE